LKDSVEQAFAKRAKDFDLSKFLRNDSTCPGIHYEKTL